MTEFKKCLKNGLNVNVYGKVYRADLHIDYQNRFCVVHNSAESKGETADIFLDEIIEHFPKPKSDRYMVAIHDPSSPLFFTKEAYDEVIDINPSIVHEEYFNIVRIKDIEND